ncbi:nudix hydrolase 2-like [Ipomoea triloba]|uniref:nudix hydrolase 2-like n=1 Tax=Ipomoea triloba TaxID=35885 RepID=UPI00125DBBC4|nr:nudix hydrolase 2-like [Ipomoea triloba]
MYRYTYKYRKKMAGKQQESGNAPRVFEAAEDTYGGVTVELSEWSVDSDDFVTVLRASLSQWRHQGKKGVWMKLSIQLACFVDAAVKEGFWFHHAEATYLMLVYWIPNTPHTIPSNASHRVGIGAFVINQTGQLLVVQENNGKFKGKGVWKLPTGVAEQGEDICDAAVREVREETGIDTEFVEILAFRQSHNSFFGKSDLFFVCMLRQLSLTINKQDSEIEKAQWMSIDEYAAQPFVQKREMFKNIAQICLAKRDNEYTGFSAIPTTTGFSAKNAYLYCNPEWMSHTH